jgi:hypothetical protein
MSRSAFSRKLRRSSSESLLHRWRVCSHTASQSIFFEATVFFISGKYYIKNGRLPSLPCLTGLGMAFGSISCGGKFNRKGTKERRILFCHVAASRQSAAKRKSI